MDVVIVFVTVPNAEAGRALARTLVEERLVACVNRLPGVVSSYRWNGAVQEDAEELLILKTTAARLPDLEARVLALHPYQVPEFLALDARHVAAGYARWVAGETAI